MKRFSVFITHAAEEDIKQAFDWYEERATTLGTQFKSSVLKAIKSIQRYPSAFQIRYRDIRVCFLDTFPFGIHYRLAGKEITIIALFHSSESPRKWPDV